MQFGKLVFDAATDHPSLMAGPVAAVVQRESLQVLVSEIDPLLADTAAFCECYHIGLDESANCVIVEAKRGEIVKYAACVILATTKADINGVIRRHLDARKISFAPMDTAIELTSMEFGGITPIGLPTGWPILVDSAVADARRVIIGSGIRASKLLLPGELLGMLPNAVVLPITK